MASQTRSPATIISDGNDFGNVDWSNPGNAASSDNAYATADVGQNNGSTTYMLIAKNYGFSIPDGATIDGIELNLEAKTAENGMHYDAHVWGVKAGVIDSDYDIATATTLTTSDAIYTKGGATGLIALGFTAFVADVNGSGFGIALMIQGTSDNDATVSVDHMPLTVYYTPSGGGGGSTGAGLLLTGVG